jgi:dimethylargininase
MNNFNHAIVRLPGSNFAAGLSTSGLGTPDLIKTRGQHARYREILTGCGLSLRVEAEDQKYPDSTFVEDTAILTPECAIVTHPGAISRQGEVDSIRPILQEYYNKVHAILPPGTLDGGDVCDAKGHFFIGVSDRTNESGARQLSDILARYGHTSNLIDITRTPGLLHLKSGLAWMGGRRMVLVAHLAKEPCLAGYELILMPEGEEYAANCLFINENIIIAEGFPKFAQAIEALGFPVYKLDMSEFRKMDGGLSCLSLRF